jgi:ketosteroid isomerase-like protein
VSLNTRSDVCNTLSIAGGNTERIGELPWADCEACAAPPEGAEAVSRGFAAALVGGDPHGAGTYLSADVKMLRADGSASAGRVTAIEALQEIAAPERELEIRIGRTMVNGALALCEQEWRVALGAEGGSGRSKSSSPTQLVLRLSEEGWEIVIAAPWGHGRRGG